MGVPRNSGQRKRSTATDDGLEPFEPLEVPVPFQTANAPSTYRFRAREPLVLGDVPVRTAPELLRAVQASSGDQLEHALWSGSLERWLRDELGHVPLSRETAALRAARCHGANLRSTLHFLAQEAFSGEMEPTGRDD